MAEAILLSALGGIAGVIMGALATAVYAHITGWAAIIPPLAWTGDLGAAIAIDAGLLPAIRAASMQPTEALHRA